MVSSWWDDCPLKKTQEQLSLSHVRTSRGGFHLQDKKRVLTVNISKSAHTLVLDIPA